MGSNTIGLLLLTDDLVSQKMVDKVFQRCIFRVLHVGKAMDALSAIWDVKDQINLLLTNIHRLQEVGSQILDQIYQMFGLPILKMTPGSNLIQWKGDETKVAAYILFDMSIKTLSEIWQLEMEAVATENQEANQQGTAEGEGANTTAINEEQTRMGKEVLENSEQGEEAGRRKEPVAAGKGKERAENSEQSQEKEEDPIMEKKSRMVWTADMHQKFLEAIELLGPDRAYPKKITQLMNIPGLTRENVASHLQKYRINVRRIEEEYKKSRYAKDLADSVSGSSLLSHHPHTSFNSALGYSGLSTLLTGSLFEPTATVPPNLLAAKNQGSQQQPYHPSSSPSQLTSRSSGSATSLQLFQPQNLTNDSLPRSYNPGYSFRGLTLTSDGKSVEFSQSNIPANYENSSNQGLPDSLLQIGSDQAELQHQHPSNPIFSDQQSFTELLGVSVEQSSLGITTSVHNPSTNAATIPHPQTSTQPSRRRKSNAPVDPTAPQQQFLASEYSSSGDDDFRSLLNEITYPDPHPLGGRDFDHAN